MPLCFKVPRPAVAVWPHILHLWIVNSLVDWLLEQDTVESNILSSCHHQGEVAKTDVCRDSQPGHHGEGGRGVHHAQDRVLQAT